MRSHILTALALSFVVAPACVWLLPDEPIQNQDGTSGGGGAVISELGGGGNGAGTMGGDGGETGCVLCDVSGEPCTTPINKVFLEPTQALNETGDADRVIPLGLAAAGNDVYAAVRYKPAITDGPGVPVDLAGYWVSRLDGDDAENVLKIHECGSPNGGLFTGPIAASPGRLHALITSAASSGGQSVTISSSIDQLGDTCAENDQTTVLTEVTQVNGLTPFVFSFDPGDPIETHTSVVGTVIGEQAALLDVDVNDSGVTAFLAVGPSGVFGTPKPANLNVAYSVGVLAPGGGDVEWHNFVSLEAAGAFPGFLDYDGGVSVDEAGGVWVTGTTDPGVNSRAFVQYRSPAGQIGLTWFGDSGSRGKTIDVRNGHVMAGIDFTLPHDVRNGIITPSGPRDFLLLHFVAQTFIDDEANPDWMYPDPIPAHDASADDTIKQLELVDVQGCGTVMYGVA